jgi:transposase
MKSNQNKSQSYSSEFKENAVKLAKQSDHSISATARELGVNVNTLHTWIKKYHHPVQAEPKQNDDLHLYDQLKEMKKQVHRLTEERDILKKAAAYFASHSS